MSRQSASSAEQNRATLKQLVKLESNKSCGDCKRNKHPRWASWNLGVFICIRCSGIHRGMGTHISRVKSVDLDTWTDEQTASMVRWGNARVNKYWEAKLAEGHVPNEAKIENFIRTKYDSRRWVMDGPMPDPATLGAEDDDVPLNVVQENLKVKAGAAGHARNGSASVVGGVAPPPRAPVAARPQQPVIDLFGDEQPARPSTTDPTAARPRPAAATAAPPKQTRPNDGLLGLDFFGAPQSAAPARAASASPSVSGAPGRTDLKQSILSLYASKPAAPTQPAANAFGGMQSPPLASPGASSSSALGGLGDAFGSLSFSSPAQQQPKAAPFSNFTAPTGAAKPTSSLSGGSFFDAKPAVPPKASSPPSFDADFGDFSSAASPAPAPFTASKPAATSSSMGDLFDLSAPAPPPKPSAAPAAATPSYNTSAFNLSQPTPAPPKPAAPVQTSTIAQSGGFNNMDAWGSSDAWATPDPPAATPAAVPKPTPTTFAASTPKPVAATSGMFDSGWGNEPAPKPAATTSSSTTGGGFSVQQDDDFGGWSHASPVATPSAAGTKSNLGGGSSSSVGAGNADDLFGNVWG